MQVKICGMRNPENIAELIKLDIDYIGYIFYDKSLRNVTQNLNVKIPNNIKKVGVFVNESITNIRTKITEYQLDVVQLHGDESPEFCRELQELKILVMKAFSVHDAFDFTQLDAYVANCDMFLFDSKGEQRGGNGTTFNWEILMRYKYETPFLLSGGIGLGHIDDVLQLKIPNMIGIDVNSGFEIVSGIKDIEKVKIMVDKIRGHE